MGRRPVDPNNPEALAALPEARRLVFAGKYREADHLVNEKMIAKPRGQMPYQTVGDLLLNFPEANAVADYRRDLDLDTAITRVSYSVAGMKLYTRELFASAVDQVIVMRISADRPGKVSFAASFKTRSEPPAPTREPTRSCSAASMATPMASRRRQVSGPGQSDGFRWRNQRRRRADLGHERGFRRTR